MRQRLFDAKNVDHNVLAPFILKQAVEQLLCEAVRAGCATYDGRSKTNSIVFWTI